MPASQGLRESKAKSTMASASQPASQPLASIRPIKIAANGLIPADAMVEMIEGKEWEW